MSDEMPLPLQHHAACSLEKVLQIPNLKTYITPGIDGILKAYLTIMSSIESEDLVRAFDSIMVMFKDDIEPHAIEICDHL